MLLPVGGLEDIPRMNRGVSVAQVVEQEIVVETVLARKAHDASRRSGCRRRNPGLDPEQIAQRFSGLQWRGQPEPFKAALVPETHDIDTNPVLRNAMVAGIDDMVAGVIARFPDPLQNVPQGALVARVNQPLHIFKNEGLGPGLFEQVERIVPQLAAVVVEAQVFACNRPALARHTGGQQIVGRQGLDLSDVAQVAIGCFREIIAVGFHRIAADLAEAEAAPPVGGQRHPEAADTGEQIHECKLGFLFHPISALARCSRTAVPFRGIRGRCASCSPAPGH